MKALIILLFFTLSLGLYLIMLSVLKFPTLRTDKAIRDSRRKNIKLSDLVDEALAGGSMKLSEVIRMNEYKRARLEGTLKAAGISYTPEEYTAHAVLKAGLLLMPMLPLFYVLPLVNIGLLVAMVLTYVKEIGKADEILKEKRERIEGELYRFVSTITQELKSSRDVLSMLEHYKENAGEDFRHELDVLCADMRSSGYEAALTRFEGRLNSPQLSDVVRGLIGVLRGDDGAIYFQMLTHDFKQLELQRLKAKAAKVPPKIRIFSFAMLMCYLATFFVIIIYEIIHSMASMF